ncbi:MAG: hypothetical protein R2813_14140, partial [Flavobacteriales bacterium]
YSIVVYNKSNSTEVQTEVQPTPSVNIVKKPDRATVRSNIAGYYKALSNSRIEQLGNYLEDPMQQWFSSTNISLSNVMADSRRYVEKYPFREANINWSTITFKELDGGLLQVTYVMDYRIKRKRLQFWSNYKLFITTVWNGDNKMVSMQEENLK